MFVHDPVVDEILRVDIEQMKTLFVINFLLILIIIGLFLTECLLNVITISNC